MYQALSSLHMDECGEGPQYIIAYLIILTVIIKSYDITCQYQHKRKQKTIGLDNHDENLLYNKPEHEV